MTQAARQWGIPLPIIRRARVLGAANVFRGQRVYETPLRAWIKANPAEVKKAMKDDSARADIARLKLEKLRAEVSMLEERNRRLAASMIPKKTVLEVWADVWSIVAEESEKLMSADKHRVLIHRCESQLAVPLATVA